MFMKLLFIFLIFGLLVPITSSFASDNESILITISSDMEEVIFDGKWTFFSEWKQTSLNTFSYDDGSKIILRSAHYGEFLFFYIDAFNDFTFNKGMDKATICIDGQNEKSLHSDKNDFCFSSTLGNKQGVVFQGGSLNGNTGNFEKIPNPENFIGVGSMSDNNNRYSKIPHASYEFKIPIEILQRSDNYGFYLSVFDANSHSFNTWPNDSLRKSFFKIPSPQTWGDIISPDKSIPELPTPLLVLVISIISIIFLSFKTKRLILRI